MLPAKDVRATNTYGFELMIVHFNTEPDTALSLINMFVEFGHPYCIVPVRVFVKLLQS